MGGRRIGVAVSDPGGLLAFPLRALERRGAEADIEAVLVLAHQQGAEAIVVGVPYSLDGSAGPQAQKVLAFSQALRGRSPLPVALWDERLSTVEAERRLREVGVQPSREKGRRDAAAAAVVLQSYLDAQWPGETG